ncbi:MAG: GTPase HflX, partial [Clostridia bacterium]|nr:GTPase HflX [Clostridia bacterium]
MQSLQNKEIEAKTRALLVGIVTRDADIQTVESELDELERLLDTAGGVAVVRVIQSKDTPDPRTLIGSGKVREISELCENNEIDLIVTDEDLSPAQI